MHLFLTDDTTTPYATLLADESRHCVRVLRMHVGDEVWVTSGNGVMCRGRIANPDEQACEVEIVQRMEDYGRRPFHIHLLVAPTKNPARLEWLLEKAVEIGVDRITPVICDHSERGVQKTDRLRRIALSAMKQSLKARTPIIDEPLRLSEFLGNVNLNENENGKFICHCAGNNRRSLRDTYSPGTDATILIGPEGDFSPREIEAALAARFLPVTLGNSRLRTETAALYTLTVLNFLNDNTIH